MPTTVRTVTDGALVDTEGKHTQKGATTQPASTANTPAKAKKDSNNTKAQQHKKEAPRINL